MAQEAESPYFRLGYNSLGAFATINHLHFQVIMKLIWIYQEVARRFECLLIWTWCITWLDTYFDIFLLQAYYLAVPFPIEKAATKKITDFNGGVEISEILNYPVRGLVFECGNSLEDLSNAVAETCICLQDNNIPYNVLISDSGRRIFVLPQVQITNGFAFCNYLSDYYDWNN